MMGRQKYIKMKEGEEDKVQMSDLLTYWWENRNANYKRDCYEWTL